jgi:long-subunit acyl-CoA synthetase (AMP-forming)
VKWLKEIFVSCHHAPDHPMIEVLGETATDTVHYSRADVMHAVGIVAGWLSAGSHTASGPLKVGLVMDNAPEWIVADLALLASGAIEIPVPLAFSADQALHLLDGIDFCLVNTRGAIRMADRLSAAGKTGAAPDMRIVDMASLLTLPASSGEERLNVVSVTGDDGICKIIHTSGTTSRPKGVRIRRDGLSDLLQSLRVQTPPAAYERYLSLVPLSLLIEQVTACYITFLDGGTLVLAPAAAPLLGESGATPQHMLATLRAARPTALTLPPSMVEALLKACRTSPGDTATTRFVRLFGRDAPALIACGGAPVAPSVLAELWNLGVRVYEGYGLSENSSVVAWNSPMCFKAGTVGKPLAHVSVKLEPDGELLIRSSSLFAGYSNEDPTSCTVDDDGWLHTGDIAQVDNEGFLRIFGRKKNMLVTANGRNVCPEWVESQYKSLDCVDHAVLFGDGLDSLHGFSVISAGMLHDTAIARITAFGTRLSDIERVARIHVASNSADLLAKFFTVTGRPRRELIWQHIENPHPLLQAEPCQ